VPTVCQSGGTAEGWSTAAADPDGGPAGRTGRGETLTSAKRTYCPSKRGSGAVQYSRMVRRYSFEARAPIVKLGS
jgi:hypothetical protein